MSHLNHTGYSRLIAAASEALDELEFFTSDGECISPTAGERAFRLRQALCQVPAATMRAEDEKRPPRPTGLSRI